MASSVVLLAVVAVGLVLAVAGRRRRAGLAHSRRFVARPLPAGMIRHEDDDRQLVEALAGEVAGRSWRQAIDE